jgi:hypothetical protein
VTDIVEEDAKDIIASVLEPVLNPPSAFPKPSNLDPIFSLNFRRLT